MADAGTYIISTDFVRPLLDGQGLRLFGSSSGYVGLKPADDAGSVDYELPAADGSSGDVLITDGSGTLSFTTPVTDHSELTGLTDGDPHPQYFLLGGRFGGQLLYGGLGPSNNLFVQSTSNAVKGYVWIENFMEVRTTDIRLRGSTSGYVGLKPPAVGDNTIYRLPTSDGSSGQVIRTDGAGNLSFVTPSAGVTDHGALTGLSDDDHSQYALLAGRSGGQQIYGGTAASDDLVLRSTSNATTGDIFLHDSTILVADKSGNSLRTSTTPASDNGIVNRGYMRANNLAVGSTKTANFTASVGEIYPVNLLSASADIAVTFPSSPNTGEKFGFFISSQHSSGGSSTNFADRPFFCIEPVTNTSINGSLYSPVSGEGSGKYGLWLTGEMLMFQYTGSTWLLIEDGRIPHVCTVERSTDQSISNSSSASVSWDNEVIDNASLHSTSSNAERIYTKRSNNYDYLFNVRWSSNNTGLRQTWLQDSVAGILVLTRKPASGNSGESLASIYAATATNYAFARVFQDSGASLNFSFNGSNFTLSEKLSR